MDWFQAIIIGLVQGLTEFIPISSTAHIRIIPSLLGWNDPGAAVTAVTQLGTLAAVFVYFRKEVVSLSMAAWTSIIDFRSRQNWSEEQKSNTKLAWFIALGTVPIGILGLTFKHQIETDLRDLRIIGGSLIVLAILLAIAEVIAKHRRNVSEMTLVDTQIIGLAQAIALIPGASRSGVTITAGLFIGLTRPSAARFSFLLSIPAVLASGLLELKELIVMGTGNAALGTLAMATLVAGVSGYASIAFLLRWLQTRSTFLFIWYRLFLGTLILWLSAASLIR
ncbi:MAG: undecaprenyl-diphosphatase UppP [Bacteroidetes bacterium]|nr:undecaprenyl-diphosphatase UppP [Bacteroidota bacterium]